MRQRVTLARKWLMRSVTPRCRATLHALNVFPRGGKNEYDKSVCVILTGQSTRFVRITHRLRGLLQIVQVSYACSAKITFFKLSNAFHRRTKNAARTITLQNNVVALYQNFYRVPFIHLVSFAQGFRQNNATKLIHFSNNACRFQCGSSNQMSVLAS